MDVLADLHVRAPAAISRCCVHPVSRLRLRTALKRGAVVLVARKPRISEVFGKLIERHDEATGIVDKWDEELQWAPSPAPATPVG